MQNLDFSDQGGFCKGKILLHVICEYIFLVFLSFSKHCSPASEKVRKMWFLSFIQYFLPHNTQNWFLQQKLVDVKLCEGNFLRVDGTQRLYSSEFINFGGVPRRNLFKVLIIISQLFLCKGKKTKSFWYSPFYKSKFKIKVF